MKQVFLLVGTLLIGSAFGQYVSKDNSKHAPFGITTVDPVVNNSYAPKAAYYTENFDSGWDGWQAAIQSGQVGFTLTSTGHNNNSGSTFHIPPLQTSTPTQWVVLDSDSYGTSAYYENATLTSPKIDLTAAGGAPLKIAYDQFFAEWTSPVDDSLWVGISTDSINWTEYSIDNGVGRDGRPNPETVLVNISNDYVANPSTVWIRFRWYGQWNYGWQIDNVRIEDLPMNDLGVDKLYTADIHTAFEYAQIPTSQTTPMTVGAIVKNQGLNDQSNVTLTATLTGSSSGQVAQQTTTIASLTSFTQDTFWVNLGYTPSTVETFTLTFDVPADDDAGNDMGSTTLDVTQYLYSHYYPSSSKFGWDSAEVRIGALFTVKNDITLYDVDAIFAEGTNIGAQFNVFIQKATGGDFQNGAVQIVQETPFTVSASDTVAASAVWKNIKLIEPPTLMADTLYVIEFGTYDAGTEPIYMNINRDGNADLSTTVYGPFGTSSAMNRFYGWGFAPAIRLNLDQSLNVEEIDNGFELGQNNPNPFNINSTINYSVNKTDLVTFKIVDITGKVVKTYYEGIRTPGSYKLNINAGELSGGVYFYTMTCGEKSVTKKMTISK